MGVKIYQVDAFTDRPFAGNPAAVCILQGPVESEWMQKVAREMNLSETAFLWRLKEGFSLRWFTPAGRWSSAATRRSQALISSGRRGRWLGATRRGFTP